MQFTAEESDRNQKYQYIFATGAHDPICSLKDLRGSSWENTLGLFILKAGKVFSVGDGRLEWENHPKKYLHTESVGLHDKYRKQGHGIHLYFALIHCAKMLGATRVYSSRHLNKYSGRMWSEKLREFFDVKGPRKPKATCRCGCRSCRRRFGRYYIDLQNLNLRDLPR